MLPAFGWLDQHDSESPGKIMILNLGNLLLNILDLKT